MVRANCANFCTDFVTAEAVDDEYDRFIDNGNNHNFTCIFCDAKMCFSRGIDEKDPHFRNWQHTPHAPDCKHDITYNKRRAFGTGAVEILKSTILPRAARLIAPMNEQHNRVIRRRFFGRDSKRFIAAVSQLIKEKKFAESILVEDGTETTVGELLVRQDDICQRLEQDASPHICIVRGFISKVIELPSGSTKVLLTHHEKAKYGNTKPFYLFMPKSMVDKNKRLLAAIEQKQMLCYGVAEGSQYGPKMDLLSINHQMHLL